MCILNSFAPTYFFNSSGFQDSLARHSQVFLGAKYSLIVRGLENFGFSLKLGGGHNKVQMVVFRQFIEENDQNQRFWTEKRKMGVIINGIWYWIFGKRPLPPSYN